MEGSEVRVLFWVLNFNFKKMGKSRKGLKKRKSHSSAIKDQKRVKKNQEVLDKLKK